MSTLLSTLPRRRRSRRRARNLRARILVGCVVLLLSAYIAWQPLPSSMKPGAVATSMTSAALLDSALPMAEPDQSIDTEGALEAPPEVIDAAYYVAER
jgi:multisubunit Na+/H+ antiporter MnhB subunit